MWFELLGDDGVGANRILYREEISVRMIYCARIASGKIVSGNDAAAMISRCDYAPLVELMRAPFIDVIVLRSFWAGYWLDRKIEVRLLGKNFM